MFVSDFGLATETFFGHAFGKKTQFFPELLHFFSNLMAFCCATGWGVWLRWLVGLKEGRGRRKKEEERGERRRREEEKGGSKEEVATLCMSVFGCAGVCSEGFGGVTIFSHVCEAKTKTISCHEQCVTGES